MSTNRSHIDKLVDIYLDALVSISNDAGWNGDSLLSRLIEFHGQIPESTRNDQSNMTMINAVQFLRDDHRDLGMIKRIINQQLGTYQNTNKVQALLARRYYVGLITHSDGRAEDRVYDDCERMRRMGRAPCNLPDNIDEAEKVWNSAERRFRQDISDAYKILQTEIWKVEQEEEAA